VFFKIATSEVKCHIRISIVVPGPRAQTEPRLRPPCDLHDGLGPSETVCKIILERRPYWVNSRGCEIIPIQNPIINDDTLCWVTTEGIHRVSPEVEIRADSVINPHMLGYTWGTNIVENCVADRCIPGRTM